MRAFTAVVLSLAAIATAAPSIPTGNNDAVDGALLKARHDPKCIYQCACNEPALTDGCCTTAGGAYDGTNLCHDMNVENHNTFTKCCGGDFFCIAPIGCPA